METRRIASLRARVERIKQALVQLGDMRPGSLSRQFNVCGKPACRCKDPDSPKKHGPYFQLSYTHAGKSTTAFVKAGQLNEVRAQLRNYQRFRKLIHQWVELSLQIAELKRKGPKM
jgi:hypothetical protein